MPKGEQSVTAVVSGLPMGAIFLLSRGAAQSYGAKIVDSGLGSYTAEFPSREKAEEFRRNRTFGSFRYVEEQ